MIGVYLSTRLKANEYHELLEVVNQIILRIKMTSSNPYVILGGDFNDFNCADINKAIGDYGDIDCITTTATRGSAILDLCATNFNSELREAYNHSPLESAEGTQSDHSFLTFRFSIRHSIERAKLTTKQKPLSPPRSILLTGPLSSLLCSILTKQPPLSTRRSKP